MNVSNVKSSFQAYFTDRRLRTFREYLTGYVMIGPAVLLLVVFGIFPILFALYVSLHKWRIIRTDYLGLDNFVGVIGNLTYLVMFFLGLLALYGAFKMALHARSLVADMDPRAWLLAIPALAHTAFVGALLRYGWFQLPEFLDIAEKLRGQEKTRELFIRLLREAWSAPSVIPPWNMFVTTILISLVLGIGATILYRRPQANDAQLTFTRLFLGLGVGIGLLYFTYNQVVLAYATALEEGTDPGIWPQMITISVGLILFAIAWRLWRSATGDETTSRQFVFRLIAAVMFMIGGWVLIGELPRVIAMGDKDVWKGLKVTVFFSMGTVPAQLAISMALAILLFREMRGSELFRMIFFLPYVTPFVASAAIFRQLFANRDTSPINLVIRGLGGEGQSWLQESRGIFDILASGVGIDLPQWLAGPSEALIVVIIHSVWTYVGYNTVIYLAGLGNIPTELGEVAEIDGANRWQIFRHITFPLLSPTTYFLSLIGIIGTFKAFATLWVFRESLALGTTDTFSVAVFLEFFEKLRYGYASAMAFVLFGVILTLTLINNRVQGSRVFYG